MFYSFLQAKSGFGQKGQCLYIFVGSDKPTDLWWHQKCNSRQTLQFFKLLELKIVDVGLSHLYKRIYYDKHFSDFVF